MRRTYMCHLILLLWCQFDPWEQQDRVLYISTGHELMDWTYLVEHLDDLCHTLVIDRIRIETFYLPSEILECRRVRGRRKG
jgi:hypothetical protein